MRKKQKVEKPKEIPVKKVIEKEEETLKIVSEPSGKLNQVHLSIKKIIENDKKKIVDKNNEKLPEENYSTEHLKMYWQQFAFIMKEKGMETFYQALVKREPLFIAEDRFGVELDNNVQLDYIKQLLTEFTDFLRTKLQNYNLTIELILSDDPLKEIKYLTGKDKFATLLKEAGPESWDDENFLTYFAFFAKTASAVRLQILQGRRARLQERVALLESQIEKTEKQMDQYTIKLQNHNLDSVESELKWIDELISSERKQA